MCINLQEFSRPHILHKFVISILFYDQFGPGMPCGNPIGRASVSWHAGARFPTGPRRPHGHAHVTCDAYFSFISFSLREPSHQTKAAATGTSDAAVLNQKLVWYCESEHACFVLFFFSIFSHRVP